MYTLYGQMDEDDSLQNTLSEGSVFKLGFFGPNAEYVYALTHFETLSLHRFHDAEHVASYGDVRDSATSASAEKSCVLEYAIDCQYHASGRLYLVGGDRSGKVCVMNVDLDNLDNVGQFAGHHSSTVTAVDIDAIDGTMTTSAEDGTVCLWRCT